MNLSEQAHVFKNPEEIFQFGESDPLPRNCRLEQPAGAQAALRTARLLHAQNQYFIWVTPATCKTNYLAAMKAGTVEGKFREQLFSYPELTRAIRAGEITPPPFAIFLMEEPDVMTETQEAVMTKFAEGDVTRTFIELHQTTVE